MEVYLRSYGRDLCTLRERDKRRRITRTVSTLQDTQVATGTLLAVLTDNHR